MPLDEYTAVTRGGLKLKGVAGSKVEKKKKKKRPKDETGTTNESSKQEGPAEKQNDGPEQSLSRALADEDSKVDNDNEEGRREAEEEPGAGKTEAEKRHEERRRKMLNDRLKREGIKTHKERVEELNRYLSGLSEHHDMPRIGPG